MIKLKKAPLIIYLFSLIFVVSCAHKKVSPIPVAKTGRVIESIDANTMRIKADGIGEDYDSAIKDALKSAIYVLVKQILSTSDQMEEFNRVAERFFLDIDGIARLQKVLKRVRTSDDRVLVTAVVIVDSAQTREKLVDLGVAKSQKEILADVDYPTIMVHPEDTVRGQRWEQIAKNQINSYLTSRKYEVLDEKALSDVRLSADIVNEIKGNLKDDVAAVAMQVGADVYIKYDVVVDIKDEPQGVVYKGTATVKAFETTTGRLIGSATAMSRRYPETAGVYEKIIVESLSDATEKVLKQINSYWTNDAKEGKSYYLLFKGNFGGKQGRRIQRGIYSLLKKISSRVKNTISTDNTLEYRIKSSLDNTELSFKIEDLIERLIPGRSYEWLIKNRKMLVLNFK